MPLMIYKTHSSIKIQAAGFKLFEDGKFKTGGAFVSIANGNDGVYDSKNASKTFFSYAEVSDIIHAIDSDFSDFASDVKNPYLWTTVHKYKESTSYINIGKAKTNYQISVTGGDGVNHIFYPTKLNMFRISLYLKSNYGSMFVWDGEVVTKKAEIDNEN
jgi:hypothetical protein